MLSAWLRALPFLSPRAVLSGDATAPALASADVWAFHARLYGFVVTTLSHVIEVQADGSRKRRIEARGVKWLSGDLRDPLRRADLMRAVFVGSGPALRHLRAEPSDLEGGVRRVETEDAVHEYRFPRRARGGFDYTCLPRAEVSDREAAHQSEPIAEAMNAPAVAIDVTVPVMNLEMCVQLARECPLPAVAFFIAPEMAVPPLGAVTLARAMRPGGIAATWDASRRRLTARVEKPIMNLRHGMAWIDAGESLPRGFTAPGRDARSRWRVGGQGGVATRPTLASQVRRAREQARITSRELARRMGVSAATVIAMESGGDPRASTLRRLLAALPDLWAEDLFAGLGRERWRRDLSPREIWLHDRNAWGVEAAEATRTLTLSAAGDGSEVIGTSRLRRLHAAATDLVVKDGISRSAHGRIGPVYLEQDKAPADPELRVRWMHVLGDAPEFNLFVPASLAATGVSFSRSDRKELAYKMRQEHADRSIGPAYECFVPLRRLVIVVRFPRGYWPQRCGVFVRAGVNVTNPRWRDLAGDLHPDGLRVTEDRKARTMELVVEHPLLGFRYSVTWQAP
jgi:transcriptional regulator with XRE-family HTH domain